MSDREAEQYVHAQSVLFELPVQPEDGGALSATVEFLGQMSAALEAMDERGHLAPFDHFR